MLFSFCRDGRCTKSSRIFFTNIQLYATCFIEVSGGVFVEFYVVDKISDGALVRVFFFYLGEVLCNLCVVYKVPSMPSEIQPASQLEISLKF